MSNANAGNGFVLGHSPPWPANVARGISPERKWQALVAEKPTHRLFRLVADRELSDAQKWEALCAELKLTPWTHRNVGDVLYALGTT